MKVSLITVVYNGAATIRSAIESVIAQDYPDIEYIIIDGASKDGTPDIVREYGDGVSLLISEPDKGIYDAMNKGVRHATGDIVGILNADDMYAHPDVISAVVARLKETGADSLIGDLVFVRPDNLDKVVRYYSSKGFHLRRFERGDMPPHPTFFVKRSAYMEHGLFDTQYRITADFELMLRFLYKHRLSYCYLEKVMVKMRTGGVSDSGIKSKIALNKEIKAGLEANGIPTSMLKIYSKYFTKVFQLVRRPAR